AWARSLPRFAFPAPVLAGAAALALARRRVARCAQRAEGERRPSDGATSELRAAFAACDLALALAAIWWAVVACTPLFFSRYLVPLSPLLCAACVLQVGCLV